MSNLQKYSAALDETLKSDALLEVNAGIAETLLDGVMNDGLAKDLPIVGTIIGLAKTGVQIKDQLFIKKIVSFLSELSDVSTEKRNEMISQIDQSGKFRVSVGHKLLYILDKCEDHEKAEVSALLFKSFLLGEIGYDEFLKANRVAENSMIEDLKWIAMNNQDQLGIEDASEMITSGLFEIEPIYLEIEEDTMSIKLSSTWRTEDEEIKPQYKVKGGELMARASFSGLIIRKCLKSKYGNPVDE